jgi:hypothetical protein
MTELLVFLAASSLVCTSATFGVWLLPLRSGVDILLAWALLATAIVVGTLLVAGAVFDELAPWLVLSLNALIAGLLALVWFALGWRPQWSWRRCRAARRALVTALRSDTWLFVLVAVACGELVWRLAIAYVLPPYANDALWYHLTTVAEWLQAGRIAPSELSVWSTVYPHNAELLFTWPTLLLGSDTFVDAVQLPFAVVGGLGVAGIGRTIGLSPRGAAAAGCLFLLAPIVLSQTTASYNDLIFIGLFLASYHFLLRFLTELRDEGRAALVYVCLAGLGGGLALGTKSLGIVYLAVASLLLIAHLLAARLRESLSSTGVVWSLLVFVVPLLAFGSYHYIETWVRFGNPVYPVKISVFGIQLFDGRSIDSFLTPPLRPGPWWREVWGQWSRDYFFIVRPPFHAYSYDDRSSGLGPLWSYLGLPLLVVLAVRLYRTNRAALVNLLLPVTAMFAIQPYRWWSRFTMILLAAGVIAIVAVVELLPSRWSTTLKASVLALVALGAFFPTVKIDGEFWATRIIALAHLPARERTPGRVVLPGYRWVDRIPPTSSIGADTSADFLGGQPYIVAYPLFGPTFEHRVYALPQSDEKAFLRTIAHMRLEYVFVHRGERLDQWSQKVQHVGCAERIYDGPAYAGQVGRVYRIVPGCTAKARERR